MDLSANQLSEFPGIEDNRKADFNDVSKTFKHFYLNKNPGLTDLH
jgi:hypothetical protein